MRGAMPQRCSLVEARLDQATIAKHYTSVPQMIARASGNGAMIGGVDFCKFGTDGSPNALSGEFFLARQ